MTHGIHLSPVGPSNAIVRRAASLSPDCSRNASGRFVDRPVFVGARAAIGTFRCPIDYPSFRDTGPIERCIVVFPRTSVWIQHEHAPRFLADPTIVTIYNCAQRYERFAASPEGDRCEWFALADDVAREIATTFDPAGADTERPYRFEWAPSSAALYVRQRALFRRAHRGDADMLEVEEEVIGIVASVLSSAHRCRTGSRARRAHVQRRHRALADAARIHLAVHVSENASVHTTAESLGTSPYHLCRVFRACTGLTMHDYRNELRVRLALELLDGTRSSAATLSTLAHRLGFCSHSHFVRAMRRHAGMTPSEARRFVSDLHDRTI